MKKTLIVIDMQNDFIDGSLGTDEAVKIVPNVRKKIEEYRSNGDEIIFTRDTHGEDYLNTPEGKKLPVVHCVKNTHGWQIADGLDVPDAIHIDKPSFGYTHWDKFCFEKVELVGLCTDICVVSNALILKALFPNAEISVDSACCPGKPLPKSARRLRAAVPCRESAHAVPPVCGRCPIRVSRAAGNRLRHISVAGVPRNGRTAPRG